jgi:hypothetical protein
MTRDFTLSRYEALCKALISSNYRSITVAEYIQGQAVEPFVILRHDVDRRVEMALEMAQMEKEMGIKATQFIMI